MTFPSWLTISSLGTFSALVAFGWQVHRARFNQSIDLLFRLEGDFFGPYKKAQRAKAAKNLLSGTTAEAEPILDFFETMALLLRKGALNQEMVWHTFFYWIDHYYQANENAIVDRQRKDPYVWKDLTALVTKLRNYQTSRPGASAYHPPTSEEIKDFLEEELTEAP